MTGHASPRRAACLDAGELYDLIRDWDDVGLLTEGQAEVLAERIWMSIQTAHDAEGATDE